MSPFDPAKRAVRQKITEVFNDAEKGERPVLRRADALFPPDSVAWKVNGDVTTMMIGGVSGLLLQMLHPAVLAGVWDHSDFRADMHGRLRRTAKFIAVTTYDHAEAGRAAIGLLAGRLAAAERLGRALEAPPATTALGALVNHITGGHLEGGGTFQPMNINYGLLPPLETPKVDHEGRKLPLKERGRAKKRLMSVRALADLDAWLGAAVADAA